MNTRVKNIDVAIHEWLENITFLIQDKFTNHHQAYIDKIISASIPVFQNYIWSALLLLQKEYMLPAKALLRVSAELVIKINWCLQGKAISNEEQNNRIKRWGKDTLYQRKIDLENMLKCSCAVKQKERAQKEYESVRQKFDELKDFKRTKIHELICEVFLKNSPIYNLGLYSQFLHAIHIDILTLGDTFTEKEDSVLDYRGDTDLTQVNSLRNECLTQTCLFLKAIYGYYGFDFKKIEAEYERLLQHYSR